MKRPELLNQKKKSGWNCVFVIVCALLVALLLCNLWFIQNFFIVNVSGGSMESTIRDGDVLYAARDKTPERGDIVIVDVTGYRAYSDWGEEKIIIKRLIAIEGDEVKCEDGVVWLRKAGEQEFSALDEPYVHYKTPDFKAVTVGEGEIFVLGDHRDSSLDSEEVGCLKLAEVLGVVPAWAVRYKDIIQFVERLRTSN